MSAVETIADARLAAVLGAVDTAIENVRDDAPLTVTLPALDAWQHAGVGVYVVSSPNGRVVVTVNGADDLLGVFATTPSGVLVGADVTVTRPTPELAGAIVAAMLAQVVTA